MASSRAEGVLSRGFARGRKEGMRVGVEQFPKELVRDRRKAGCACNPLGAALFADLSLICSLAGLIHCNILTAATP